MTTATERTRARQCVTANALQGNKIVSYRGGASDVTTVGYIDRENIPFGDQVPVNDLNYVATLLIEDVGEIHNGDRVTDEDGQVWSLLSEISNDDYVTDWSVQRR